MTPYNQIRKVCENTSRLSAKIIDGFLIGYAVRLQGLEKKMEQQFARYSHMTKKFERGGVGSMKSQYIAHRIFREDGMIGKLLRSEGLKRFRGEERTFLEKQDEVPWRFSFGVIRQEPEEDFFLMEDIHTAVEYLLFSPTMSILKESGPPLLWLNLVGFNGECWQSYGPIGAFNGFLPDDIFFFATELDPDIEDGADVARHMEADPVPYMMLISGAMYPLTFHKDEEMRYMMAEYDLDTLDTAALKNSFQTEFDSGVYRLTPKRWGEPPHLACAYFDENNRLILLTAMTNSGFRGLVKGMNRFGYHFSGEPLFTVNTAMLASAGEILKRTIVLNEYEELFTVESDPEHKEQVDRINEFIAMVLPDINAGRKPDIEAAARKSGLAMESALDIVNMVLGKRDDLAAGVPHMQQKEAELFRRIYLLAGEIRQMEPWKWMRETDLFGVRLPDSSRVYFISVMGAEGQFFALSAYKGYEGLAQFIHLQEQADNLRPETLLTIPHLMLSYTDRERLSKEHLESIRRSGIKFRGKGNWPLLEEIVPGFVPVLPEGNILRVLPVLLDEVANVLLRAREDPGCLYREDPSYSILVRTPSENMSRLKWEDRYVTLDPEWSGRGYRLDFSRKALSEVTRLPEGQFVLQADLIMLPTPVMEKGRKGFFPFVLLLVEKESGMVPGMAMLAPEPDLHAMHESIPEKMLEELAKLGSRPRKIEMRDGLLFFLLEKALNEAYCSPVRVDRMPQLDDAFGSLVGHLNSKSK